MREFAAWVLVALLLLIASAPVTGEDPKLVQVGAKYLFAFQCFPKADRKSVV